MSQLRDLILLTVAIAWALAMALMVDQAARHSFLVWVEHWSGDWRTVFFADRRETQHPDVAVIGVTEETLNAFPYRLPVDRAYLARLISTLDEMGAKAIGIDFLVIRPTEPDKDRMLVRAVRNTRARVVVAVADRRAGLTDAESAYQARFLAETGATGGYANLLTGNDRIVRDLAPREPGGSYPISFANALAAPGAGPIDEPRRIAWLLKPEDNSDTFLTLPAHLVMPPAVQGPSPMMAAFTPLVRDKIVIIGSILPDVDRHQTPLPDWEGENQSGVFLQAQVVAQILEGRNITRLRRDLLLVIYGVLALIGFGLALRRGRLAFTVFTGTVGLLIAAVDIALFVATRQFLPFGGCMLAIFLGGAGGLLVRVALRFLARWDARTA